MNFFKNASIFRLSETIDIHLLADTLQKQPFTPCGSQEPVSIGWTEIEGYPFISVEGQILLLARTESKIIPTAAINLEVKTRSMKIEQDQGYKVGRKQAKELKEDIITELLPRALTTQRDTWVWIDTKNNWLVIDSSSSAVVDLVMGLIAKTFDPFPALPTYTQISPVTVMTEWLVSNSPFYPFTIDQDAELKDMGESRSVVRYSNHNLDNEEICAHISNGKRCTRLALTWDDKVSFTLTDDLNLKIKGIKPTDLLAGQLERGGDSHEIITSMLTLVAGELNGLITSLILALGGERTYE